MCFLMIAINPNVNAFISIDTFTTATIVAATFTTTTTFSNNNTNNDSFILKQKFNW